MHAEPIDGSHRDPGAPADDRGRWPPRRLPQGQPLSRPLAPPRTPQDALVPHADRGYEVQGEDSIGRHAGDVPDAVQAIRRDVDRQLHRAHGWRGGRLDARGDRDAIDRFAIPFFGTVPLDRVDPPLLRDFINYLAAQTASEPKRKPQSGAKRTLARATVRRYYAPVRAMLATAYEDGLLRSNPALGVRVIVKDRRPKTPLWLTADQTRALLAAMPGEDADLAYFLAATGCRISEALAGRWCDVGLDDNARMVLTIPKAKTPAGERVIPLSPETVRRLNLRRTGASFGADDDPIFPSSTGTPIDPHNYRRNVFEPAARAASVPWATPHKLRHGLASLMANQGYSAAQIAAHLGHADGGVLALKTYIHPDVLDSIEFIDVALA